MVAVSLQGVDIAYIASEGTDKFDPKTEVSSMSNMALGNDCSYAAGRHWGSRCSCTNDGSLNDLN